MVNSCKYIPFYLLFILKLNAQNITFDSVASQIYINQVNSDYKVTHEYINKFKNTFGPEKMQILLLEQGINLQHLGEMQSSLDTLLKINKKVLPESFMDRYYYALSTSAYRTSRFDLALNYLDTLNSFKQYFEGTSLEADRLIQIANVYFYKGKMTEAIYYYNKGISKFQSLNMFDNVFIPKANLAAIFIEIGNYKEAIRQYLALKKTIEQNNKYERFLPNILVNLGIAYEKTHLDSSLYYYNLLNKTNNKNYQWAFENGIGNTYLKLENYKEAENHLNRAKQIADSLNLIDEFHYADASLCDLYFKKGNNKEAKNCYERNRNYFINNESPLATRDFLRSDLLFKYKNLVNDEYFEKFLSINDSLQNSSIQSEINNTLFKIKQQALQDSINTLLLRNELKESKIHQNKLRQRIYIAFGLSSLIIALFSFIYYRKEKENNLLWKARHQELLDFNNELIGAGSIQNKFSNNPLDGAFITLTNREKTKIPLGDILYLEARNKSIYIYTDNGKEYRDWQTLKSYSEILPDEYFIQIHRSFITNSLQIQRIEKNLVFMNSGKELKISNSHIETVKKIFLSDIN